MNSTRTDSLGGLLPYLALLSAISFVLHFAWEYIQCQPFFVHGAAPATLSGMLGATLGDLVLTGLVYAGVAAVARNWRWPRLPWTPGIWVALLGLSLAIGVSVEWYALSVGRWSYTGLAPLLPMTSLSVVPLLQLVILLPLSFGLAAWLRARARDAVNGGVRGASSPR